MKATGGNLKDVVSDEVAKLTGKCFPVRDHELKADLSKWATEYGNSFSITRKMVDDDLYDVSKDTATRAAAMLHGKWEGFEEGKP